MSAKIKLPPSQRRKELYVMSRPGGNYAKIRVTHRKECRKGRRTKNARCLLRCGCCEEKVEIYHDDRGLEINGVSGSLENWREILLPLLGMNPDDLRKVNAMEKLEQLRKKYKHVSA